MARKVRGCKNRVAQKPRGFLFQKCASPPFFSFFNLSLPLLFLPWCTSRAAAAGETDPLLPWELAAACSIPHVPLQGLASLTSPPDLEEGHISRKLWDLLLPTSPPHPCSGYLHLIFCHTDVCVISRCTHLPFLTTRSHHLQSRRRCPDLACKVLDHLTHQLTRTIGHTWKDRLRPDSNGL